MRLKVGVVNLDDWAVDLKTTEEGTRGDGRVSRRNKKGVYWSQREGLGVKGVAIGLEGQERGREGAGGGLEGSGGVLGRGCWAVDAKRRE